MRVLFFHFSKTCFECKISTEKSISIIIKTIIYIIGQITIKTFTYYIFYINYNIFVYTQYIYCWTWAFILLLYFSLVVVIFFSNLILFVLNLKKNLFKFQIPYKKIFFSFTCHSLNCLK